ncbi:unnamed protein product [Cuscuta campestris]|uniref:SWIM-type domain-containing protein n=1 Tax=Cuscuta campestris TaxID=132261 RepID=A0A484KQR9_9ASTE|nr:unnamed protein product [Cuscuta campestris]
MYKAGDASNRNEFDQLLLRIASKNQEAYNWLNAIPKHKWALSHDEGGTCYGIMTTNSSESFNNVLKGCRCLPVYAIVKFTYEKLVKLFAERQTNGYVWQQSGYNFPMNVWKHIRKNEENRLYYRVVQHHAQEGIYSVVVDGSSYIAQWETFTVNLNARTCSCGQWVTFHLPCSHVHAVCHYCSVTVDHLIPNVFSIQCYINASSGIIMPLPDESEWPTPEYEILRLTPRQTT